MWWAPWTAIVPARWMPTPSTTLTSGHLLAEDGDTIDWWERAKPPDHSSYAVWCAHPRQGH